MVNTQKIVNNILGKQKSSRRTLRQIKKRVRQDKSFTLPRHLEEIFFKNIKQKKVYENLDTVYHEGRSFDFGRYGNIQLIINAYTHDYDIDAEYGFDVNEDNFHNIVKELRNYNYFVFKIIDKKTYKHYVIDAGYILGHIIHSYVMTVRKIVDMNDDFEHQEYLKKLKR